MYFVETRFYPISQLFKAYAIGAGFDPAPIFCIQGYAVGQTARYAGDFD